MLNISWYNKIYSGLDVILVSKPCIYVMCAINCVFYIAVKAQSKLQCQKVELFNLLFACDDKNIMFITCALKVPKT